MGDRRSSEHLRVAWDENDGSFDLQSRRRSSDWDRLRNIRGSAAATHAAAAEARKDADADRESVGKRMVVRSNYGGHAGLARVRRAAYADDAHQRRSTRLSTCATARVTYEASTLKAFDPDTMQGATDVGYRRSRKSHRTATFADTTTEIPPSVLVTDAPQQQTGTVQPVHHHKSSIKRRKSDEYTNNDDKT